MIAAHTVYVYTVYVNFSLSLSKKNNSKLMEMRHLLRARNSVGLERSTVGGGQKCTERRGVYGLKWFDDHARAWHCTCRNHFSIELGQVVCSCLDKTCKGAIELMANQWALSPSGHLGCKH